MGDGVAKSSGGDSHYRLAWSAISISLSALFYLFDVGTNLLTLHTYYLYSVVCPSYYSSQPHPPKCDLIVTGGHSFRTVFYLCLCLMAGAHLSNTLIFWRTLDPSAHPLRLAYFLPLIHLSRLLKVLWCSCSSNSLENLEEDQKESSSLYNVLAASLETAPQLMLQFHVVMQFGDEDSTPYYTRVTAQPVPKTLILSLLASLASGTYNGSVAVLSLLQKRHGIMSLQWKACILMVAGFHILAAMAAKTLIVAALAEDIIPVGVYLLIGFIVAWIFVASVLQKSQHDIQYSSNNLHKWKRRMVHGVHSLALAHVSLFIGPMYVIVKHFDTPTFFLMWGTILHIFVELLGLGAVLVTLGANGKNPGPHWPAWQSACHHNYPRDGGIVDNIYLSCNVFVEAVCPLLFLLLISSLVFSMVGKRAYTRSCESEHQIANLNASQDEHELAVLDVASNEMETIAPTGMSMPKKDEHELVVLDVASNQMETITPNLNVSKDEHQVAVLDVASIQMEDNSPKLDQLAVLDVASNKMETIALAGMSMPEKYEHELAVLDVASNQMKNIAPNLNASKDEHEVAKIPKNAGIPELSKNNGKM